MYSMIQKTDTLADAGLEQEEVESMDLEAAQEMIVQLQASLQAREMQLERKMEEVASVQDTMQQVMVSLLSRKHPLYSVFALQIRCVRTSSGCRSTYHELRHCTIP